MPIFTVSTYVIPLEVSSGTPFVLAFLLDTDWVGSGEDVVDNQVTCQLISAGRVLFSTVIGLDHETRLDGKHRYSGIWAFNVSEIEYILNRVPSQDETPTINLTVKLSWLADGFYFIPQSREETHDFTWTPLITVSETEVLVSSFPESVKKGTPFSVSFTADWPSYPKNVSYMRNYIEATCVGEDGVQRTYIIWEDVGNGVIYSPFSVQVSGVDIENILGYLTIPYQHYNVTVAVGSIASGVITGTDTPWVRTDEVTMSWPIDVIVGLPSPDFLPPPASIWPPYTVKTTDIIEIILAVENYGSSGMVYIDCNDSELWRGNLGYLATGIWDSGKITIEWLLGTITVSGQYQIVFKCGYIDNAGNKVLANSSPHSIYVTVVTPPPGKVFLTISAEAGGTTTPLPGTYEYDIGASVTVKAIPGSGYAFDHWEGTSGPSKITLELSSSMSVVATFAISEIKPIPAWAIPTALACITGLGMILYGLTRKR